MDAKTWFESLKLDTTCPLCLDYFIDPVIIKCAHTFCKECLLSFWKEIHTPKTCPICRATSAFEEIVCNRRMQNLANISKMLRPHLLQSISDPPICDKHGKEQTFFCEEDHNPLCAPCFLTTHHKEHKVLLLEVAVSQCMEKLEATKESLRLKKKKFQVELKFEKIREAQWEKKGHILKALVVSEYEKIQQFFWEEEQIKLQTLDKEARENLKKKTVFRKIFNRLKKSKKQALERLKLESQVKKQWVKSEFDEKHQLLSEEKELYLKILNQEAKDNLAKFEESKTKMNEEIYNLKMVILEIENNYDKLPLEMLQDAKDILQRSEELLLQNPMVASPRCSMYPMSGMTEMLLTFHRHICLDPKTANPYLTLSEDLQSVEYSSVPQDVPDNPERFDFALCVLAIQKFTSGKHYWEVMVGNKKEWELGICKESIRRKGDIQKVPEDKFTLVAFTFDNHFHLRCSNQNVPLCKPIHKVGIFLDYERGHIAFYNATDGTIIYSPPKKAFQGPLLPYFSPCFSKVENTSGYLHICPKSNKKNAEEDDNY